MISFMKRKRKNREEKDLHALRFKEWVWRHTMMQLGEKMPFDACVLLFVLL